MQSHKKKLIVRLATGCGVLLTLALACLLGAFVKDHQQRRSWDAERRARRDATVERSRKYLGEVARRVTKLPADPAVLGEIESRYFEEYAHARMHVWATGTTGEFLFGVPREAFAKLNAIYDRDVVPRLRDGVFLDRQTFLRRLVDGSDDIDSRAFAEEPAEAGDDEPKAGRRRRAEEAWERWGRGSEDSERSFVLSTPLRGTDGQALGSLYVKTVIDGPRDYYSPSDAIEALAAIAGGVAGFAVLGLWLLLPSWVFVDARSRGVRRAPLWAFLTALSLAIGLVVYLIARPEHPGTLTCPGCGKDVDGGAYCPHCGRDLTAAFCATCRYPLKPDWAFCPACRTEIRPQSPAAVVAEAESAG
jgi:hypothetical protein